MGIAVASKRIVDSESQIDGMWPWLWTLCCYWLTAFQEQLCKFGTISCVKYVS